MVATQNISCCYCHRIIRFLEEDTYTYTKDTFTFILFYFIFSTFIYFLGDRERQSMNGGGAEREGDTESETGSRHRAISPEPDAGLELTDREIVTWLKSDA